MVGECKGKGRLASSMALVKMYCIALIMGYQCEEAAVSLLTVFLIIVRDMLTLVPQMNNLNEQARW